MEFQNEVNRWCIECFGPEETMDVADRTNRFVEESLELAQAAGAPKADVLKLVDYVYGRPVGEVSNEVGGVSLTLAALCTALGLSVRKCADAILPYAWANVERIKAKRAARVEGSPLPGHSDIPVVEQEPVARETAKAHQEPGTYVVDIADVERAQAFLKAINDKDLFDITWTRNGEVVPVTEAQIERWKFIGLSNTLFAEQELP